MSDELTPTTLMGSPLVVLTGVGKSYHVAALGASLLQSVRVPAVAASATELLHGSLNMLRSRTGSKFAHAPTLIGISHSGYTHETAEVLRLANAMYVHRMAITGDIESPLASAAHRRYVYDIESDGSRHGTIPLHSVHAQIEIIGRWVTYIADQMTADDLRIGHPEGMLATEYAKEILDGEGHQPS